MSCFIDQLYLLIDQSKIFFIVSYIYFDIIQIVLLYILIHIINVYQMYSYDLIVQLDLSLPGPPTTELAITNCHENLRHERPLPKYLINYKITLNM